MTEKSPNTTSSLLKNAIVFHLQGELGPAEELYRQILDHDQHNPALYANLGTLCLATNRSQEAIHFLHKALELNPTYPLALNSLGVAWQRQGNWERAVHYYQKALDEQVNYPDAWNNLGYLLQEQGRYGDAVKALRRSLEFKGDDPSVWFSLGHSLSQLNRIGDAIHAYEQVLKLQPQSHLALNHLGQLFQKRGNVARAEQCYRQALELCPDFLEAQGNLAQLLTHSQQDQEAIATYQKLVAALEKRDHEFKGSPLYQTALQTLGFLLANQGDYGTAATLYERAIEQQPNHAPLHQCLGNVLQSAYRFEEAILAYRLALDLDPSATETWVQLGKSLGAVGRYGEAVQALERTIALDPDGANGWTQLGMAYHHQGDLWQGEDCYQMALTLDPQQGEARLGLAMILLAKGQYRSGWPSYQARFHGSSPIVLNTPAGMTRWDGRSPILGDLILVVEQGLGEVWPLLRFTDQVRQRLGPDWLGNLVLQVPAPWLPLLNQVQGFDRLQAEPTDLEDLDLFQDSPSLAQSLGLEEGDDRWYPLLDLPQSLSVQLATIPSNPVGLQVDPLREQLWRQRLGPHLRQRVGLQVGLGWVENYPRLPQDTVITVLGRSPTLADFAPLTTLEGVNLLALQPWSDRTPQEPLPWLDKITTLNQDWGSPEQFWVDIVAILRQLDLVITVDQPLAHLAASLGIPTWILLPQPAHWWWLLDRDDSPWYPTARLFRQPQPGDWAPVFAQVTQALEDYLRASEG